MFKQTLNYFLLSIAYLLLISCGGGSSNNGSNTNTQAPAVTNDSPGGIWTGTVTYTDSGQTDEAVGFVTEAGELRSIIEDSVTGVDTQLTGNLSVTVNSFSGSFTQYAPLGFIFSNGLSTISGTASGTINERSTFSGSASIDGTITSNFNFTYESIYERDSSLSAISGVYSESDGVGYTVTYAIDSAGVITGSDTDGCQINGNVTILNVNYNMYRINATVTNCGSLNGNYSGLAALLDLGGTPNDTLGLSVSGSNYVISGTIPKT